MCMDEILRLSYGETNTESKILIITFSKFFFIIFSGFLLDTLRKPVVTQI